MATRDAEVPTVQFFQLIQKMYGIVGIHPLQTQNVQFSSVNWRNFSALLSFVILFFASTAYLFTEAESFVEYSQSFYVSSALVGFFTGMSVTVSKMANVFILIEKFGEFVEKSKKKIWKTLKKLCIE